MSDVDVAAVAVVVLDPGRLSDQAVRRVAVGAAQVHLLGEGREDAARWRAVRDGIAVQDDGPADDMAAALAAAVALRVPVVVCPPPRDPTRFVTDIVRGAVDAAASGLPAVAVHVARDTTVEGPVAWLSETGAQSGYGVLFAVGYAQLHGLDVTLVQPHTGVGEPRTPDALDDAMTLARATGVRITEVSDPSPVARVLRDPFSVAVQPVLDVPAGAHAGDPSVGEGNVAAVVRLLDDFAGDVVIVLDGVRLGAATSHLAQWMSAAVLSVLTVGAVGVALAPAAGAAGGGGAGVASSSVTTGGGVLVSASGHNGASHTGTFTVQNLTGGPVTLQLVATWVHSGNHPPVQVVGATVTIAAGATGVQSFEVPRPTGVTGHGGYHLGSGDALALVVHGPDGSEIGRVPFGPGTSLPPQIQLGGHPATTVTHPQGPTVVPPTTTSIPVPMPVQTPPLLPPQQVPTPVVTPPQVPQLTPTLPPTTQQVPTPVVTPPQVTPPQVPQLTPTLPPTTQQVTPPQIPQLTPTLPPTTQQVPGTTQTPQTPQTPHTPDTVPTTTHHQTTDSGRPPTAVTGGGEELAHTGAGQTGLLAGLAAALVAAGAGMVALGREKKPEQKG